MEKWDLILSVTETNNYGLIKLRQNNTNSESIRVQLTRKGTTYDLTALKVFFVTHFNGKDNLKVPIQKAATIIDAKEGIFEFVFDQDCMQRPGRQEAYFEIYDFDKYLDTTQNFTYEIVSSSRQMKADFTPWIGTWVAAEEMLDEGTAKVLNDKTEKLELQKANVVDVDQQFIKQTVDTDLKLDKKANEDDVKIKFSEIEKDIADTAVGLVGDYNSEAALKAAHPKGAKGYATVETNGVVYRYTWNGTQWVNRGVFIPTELPEKSVKRNKMEFPTEIGFISLGNAHIDHNEKTITIQKGSILSTHNIASVHSLTEDTIIRYESASYAYFFIFDRNDSTFKLTPGNNDSNYIIIGVLYAGMFYASMQNSRITEFPVKVSTKRVSLSFINFSNNYISIDTKVKTVKISAGNCPIDNVSGLFYRNASEILLDYNTLELKGNNLPSLYFTVSTGKYYVDINPKNDSDAKVFTWYEGKIYNADDSTKRITVVNGVKNGGYYVEPLVPITRFDNKLIFFSECLNKIDSVIGWIGDSTWAGYTGPENGSTIPFVIRIQNLLNSYFGDGVVTSKNLSESGKSIIYARDNFQKYIDENPKMRIAMIGDGLNEVSLTNISARMKAFEDIIRMCFDNKIIPVICTPQAHQLALTDSQDYWPNRTHQSIVKYDLQMRLGIAKKYNLDVIDFHTFTEKLLFNAPEKIYELVNDGLHGSAIMHEYQKGFAFKELVPTVKSINNSCIIPIYDQKVFGGITTRNVKSIERDEDGFKTQYQYHATKEDLLIDIQLFLEPEEKFNYDIQLIGNGNYTYTVNEVEAGELTNLKCSIQHIKVYAQKSDELEVIFKGLKIINH